MKKGVVVAGVVIIILGVLLYFSGNNMVEEAPWNILGGGGYSGYENDMATGRGMISVGVILSIIGLIAVVSGFVAKNYKGVNSVINERFCPNCGRAIPFDARACPYCSKKFDNLNQSIESKKVTNSDKTDREIYCSACERTIPNDANICPYCGEKFDNSEAKMCPSCGVENTADGKFCKECGNKL